MKKFIKKLLGIDKLEAELEEQKDINIRLFAIATSEKIDHQTAVRLFVHDKKDLATNYREEICDCGFQFSMNQSHYLWMGTCRNCGKISKSYIGIPTHIRRDDYKVDFDYYKHLNQKEEPEKRIQIVYSEHGLK
jgi:hypothetical protein